MNNEMNYGQNPVSQPPVPGNVPSNNNNKKSGGSKIVPIIMGIIIVALIGCVVFLYLNPIGTKCNVKEEDSKENASELSQEDRTQILIEELTKYDSINFMFGKPSTCSPDDTQLAYMLKDGAMLALYGGKIYETGIRNVTEIDFSYVYGACDMFDVYYLTESGELRYFSGVISFASDTLDESKTTLYASNVTRFYIDGCNITHNSNSNYVTETLTTGYCGVEEEVVE